MTGLGLALTLAGLGAQAFGSAKSAQANEAFRRKLLEKSESLDAAFNKEYNMDYMQTPSMKNLMASYSQGLKDVSKNVEGRAAMAGASPESVIAEREAINENYGDFIRKVSSGGEQYKMEKERMYNLRRDAMDERLFSAEQQKASQWDSFMKNAAGLTTGGISAGAIEGGSSGWLNNLFKKKIDVTTLAG